MLVVISMLCSTFLSNAASTVLKRDWFSKIRVEKAKWNSNLCLLYL